MAASVYSADGARHKLDHLHDFSMPCGTGMATVCTRQTALGTSWITSPISPCPVALGWPQCVLGRRRSAQAGSPLRFLHALWHWRWAAVCTSAQLGSKLDHLSRFLHALWHWDGHSGVLGRTALGTSWITSTISPCHVALGWPQCAVCTRQTALGTSWTTSPTSPCPVATPMATVCTRQTALGTSWNTSTISPCPVALGWPQCVLGRRRSAQAGSPLRFLHAQWQLWDGHSVYSADGARHKLDHLLRFLNAALALGWPQCALGRRRSAQAGSPLRFLHALWHWDGHSVYSADGARHKLDHLYDFSMPCGTGMATVCTRQTALGTSWITSTISPCPVALGWPQCVLGRRRSAQAGSPLRFLHALWHWDGHSVYSADGARHKLDHLYDFSMPCGTWMANSVYSADGARHKLDHLFDFSMPCGTGMATVCTRQTALGTTWITSTVSSPCPVALAMAAVCTRQTALGTSWITLCRPPLRFLHALWHWDGRSVYSADGARHKLDHLYDFSMPCGTGMAAVCTRQTALGTSWITSTISSCPVTLGWPQCVLGRRRSAQAGSPLRFLHALWQWDCHNVQCVLGRRRSAQVG